MFGDAKAKELAKKITATKESLLEITADLKNLGPIDRSYLKGQLSKEDYVFFTTSAVLAQLLKENDERLKKVFGKDIKLKEGHTVKKSWLWGLIKSEKMEYTGEPITMSISEFTKRTRS